MVFAAAPGTGYTRFRTCQISTETVSQATVAPMSVNAGEKVIRFSRSRPEPVIQREPRSTGTR
jgi:hypothetical protein